VPRPKTRALAARPLPQRPAGERRAGRAQARASAVVGLVQGEDVRALPAAKIVLRHSGGRRFLTETDAEGLFRLGDLPAGRYEVSVTRAGFAAETSMLDLGRGAMRVLNLKLKTSPQPEPAGTPVPFRAGRIAIPGPPPLDEATYRALLRQPAEQPPPLPVEEPLPAAGEVFLPRPDRWGIDQPDFERYPGQNDSPWVEGRLLDPYNRNPLKGDYPVIGQRIFFNFTGTSETFFTVKRLYVPSGPSAENPTSVPFFGRGGLGFVAQTIRLSFDLFKGDTAYRPFDWRVKVTPAINLNYLRAQERGVVNFDVRRGTTRLDGHVGLQEAFFEAKFADLSHAFDFVSIRAGIQPFNSDFRGFLFVDEQPGVRVFGTLASQRIEYNAGYFYFLEKDTNSLLNSFAKRHQQVFLANVYLQDFLHKGYTTQFSFHFNKDDADFHFDHNNFLVRPQAIGAVQPHDIRAYYLGWTGNGHIGRLNISHAFYQVLGEDQLNPLAGRKLDLNAQMAALELSVDKDWMRFRAAAFFASGDARPRDDKGRGFDAILDVPVFAGGIFSFWNREAIRLTGTGVGLMQPNSFLPSLRSSKDEGQANFVNPGIFLVHAGADFELTPKMRGFANVNVMRFHRTEPLELLLFQAPIRSGIGADYSLGVRYRPPLTENIVLTGGVSALTPFSGLRRIYQDKTVYSLFILTRLQF
jgi:hypothetical protein